MIWSVVQVVGRQGISALVFTVLALFLKPSEFGVVAMVMVWLASIRAFSQLGFGSALVQRENVRAEHFSTVFVINVGCGIGLTALGVLISNLCSRFFGEPGVEPLCVVLSFNYLINSFSLTHLAIAQRDLRFRDLAIRDLSAVSVAGVAGIGLAIYGFGVWSLVAHSLLSSLIGTILIWRISPWRPSVRGASFELAKELWPYSSKVFLFDLVKFFAQNLDKLLIGYLLGSAALGLYSFAFRLVVVPVQAFVGAIGAYLFPKLSMIQDAPWAVRRTFLLTLRTISALVMPLMVIVFLMSSTVIPLIWGKEWIGAIPVVRILTLLVAVQSLISPIGQLMKALGRPNWLLNWSICITAIAGTCIYVGCNWGLRGAAAGLVIAYIIGLPINYVLIARLTPIRLRDLFAGLFPSVVSSCALFCLVFAFPVLQALSVPARAIAGCSLCAVLYVTLIWLMDRESLSTILKEFSRT